MSEARYIRPWTEKYPCDRCGNTFLATRGDPLTLEPDDEIICSDCEMYERGHLDGLAAADTRVNDLRKALEERDAEIERLKEDRAKGLARLDRLALALNNAAEEATEQAVEMTHMGSEIYDLKNQLAQRDARIAELEKALARAEDWSERWRALAECGEQIEDSRALREKMRRKYLADDETVERKLDENEEG